MGVAAAMSGGYTGPLPSVPMPDFGSAPTPAPYYPPAPGSTLPPSVPFAPPEPAPNPQAIRVRPGTVGATTSAGSGGRGTVVVKLPADARLFADGSQLRLTGSERRFVTPVLPEGQEFVYRFKVDYDRDGETVSVTKRVPVRAGGTVQVEFLDLTAARPSAAHAAAAATPTSNQPPVVTTPSPVSPAAPSRVEPPAAAPASDRATITVKLPAGATLFVDDRKSASVEPVRQFTTPPLPTGKDYAYLMKAEVIRDGRPEYLIQKVPFRAGEKVTVDFTGLDGR